MTMRTTTTMMRAVLMAAATCGTVAAEDLWQRETLTGGWGGRRDALSARGVELESVYTGEVAGAATGGLDDGHTYLDNVDLVATLDLNALRGWDGWSASVYVLGNQGGDPGAEHVGDAQGVSNIEAPDTWKLYELWLQRQIGAGSLRLGLYDLNSEFDAIETAGLFLNSSHGIGPDISQSGANGPSIFPTTSVALRWQTPLRQDGYLQLAVLDGVPGDLEDPEGTRLSWSGDEGLLLVVEAGQTDDGTGRKLAVGAWGYTAEYDDVVDVDDAGRPVPRRGNWGLYALGETQVSETLRAYGRVGVADPRVNAFLAYTGAGVVGTGLLPGRPDDALGLAWAAAHHSGRVRDLPGMAAAEHALEVSYRAQLLPWLAVQPDLQWIHSPGAVEGRDAALVTLLRFETVF